MARTQRQDEPEAHENGEARTSILVGMPVALFERVERAVARGKRLGTTNSRSGWICRQLSVALEREEKEKRRAVSN